jgi:4-hydroxy-tetrahydrodipicolinate reductase
MSLRISVLGGTGRTGQLVVSEVESVDFLELVTVVSLDAVPLGKDCFLDSRVVIDFSTPQALSKAIPYLEKRALVSGTTGLTPIIESQLDDQAKIAPVLSASNFSTGLNVLLDLVARATRALPGYQIEIVEAHHRHKTDAPSGTALALGKVAATARELPLHKIPFHSLRCGDVAGEHTVWIAGDGDRLQLTHVASSRIAFAQGAIQAARWIARRSPGRYTMHDVLGL